MRLHTRFLLNIMISDIWTVFFGALLFLLWICQGSLAYKDWMNWSRLDCINTIVIMHVKLEKLSSVFFDVFRGFLFPNN